MIESTFSARDAQPNLVIDVSKDPSPRVVSSIWVMLAVSTVFLFLRVYCKKIRCRGLWVDDYLLIASWILLLVSNILITELMRLGLGRTTIFVAHMHTLTAANGSINKAALALSKTSFAATLLRVSSGRRSALVWILVVSMNVLLAAGAVTAWKPACDRPADTYEAILPGKCWSVRDSVIMAMVSNGYSALVDFVLALLSWHVVWNLDMKRHEKVGVAVAMSLGIIAGLVGVIKVVKIATLAEHNDIPYRLSLLFIWGQAEPNVTIVASSIPVLRVLFQEMCSSSPSRSTYLKSDARSTFPASIGMATLEEGRQIEEASRKRVLQAMGPSEASDPRARELEVEIGYGAMDEITQGTHHLTPRASGDPGKRR
ncbi:hypothetical protein CMUS01_04577 [Colletotrichum musicola]|uniref:Rhodopsin domain-containing protein n=1 Tax=Colletotrichum musicola TaxID=2175873 RepID=A0A8H6NLX6_9PEZI|nr:hypothetical protein CMUS01_04577 [Colletotrichum musicola]